MPHKHSPNLYGKRSADCEKRFSYLVAPIPMRYPSISTHCLDSCLYDNLSSGLITKSIIGGSPANSFLRKLGRCSVEAPISLIALR